MKSEIIVDELFLHNYWKNELKLPVTDQLIHSFIEGFKQQESNSNSKTLLYLNTNGWKVSIKENLVKTLLIAPVIATTLHYLGFHDLSGFILPTIIPMLFDIENIELDKKEEEIWIHLPVKKFKGQFKSAEDWYDSLPEKIKEQIHPLDFKNFIEKLVFAGLAKQNKIEKYLLFKKEEHIFKIRIS
jgi:hypothetical protein